MTDLTLVVLAAGMGSRYGGLKQLDGVGPNGEVIMEYSVYDAVKAGARRIVFVIRDSFQEAFRDTLLSRLPGSLDVRLALQRFEDLPADYCSRLDLSRREKPWGTGQAVWSARSEIDGPFMAINADDYYGGEAFQQLARALGGSGEPNPCMVGFRLANTLSPTGTVSRGVCEVHDGLLRSIQERTRLRMNGNGKVVDDDSGTSYAPETLVSMNCWGFGQSFLHHLSQDFTAFLQQVAEGGADMAKGEFYLPAAVDRWRAAGHGQVRVKPSEETWLGVTYPEDKDAVVRGIEEKISLGEYPERLWS
jgi:NDP-sugar pyrophosphorylase family protein